MEMEMEMDRRSDFLETTREEMAGTPLCLFLILFHSRDVSVPSAVFLFDRAFVCFVLVWLFIIWPFLRF